MSDEPTVSALRILPRTGEEVDIPNDAPTVEDPPEDIAPGGLLDDVLTGKRGTLFTKGGEGGPGRPLADVDDRIVLAMAVCGATTEEIAKFFSVSKSVIEKRFQEALNQGRASRKIRLRQAQTRTAIDGSVPMLIWLGKQELKQFDESRVRIGNLQSYSDAELAQLAAGKLPGQIGSGESIDSDEKETDA